jgi:hypothetical protein
MVWVAGTKGSKFFQHYGKIEDIKEEEVDDDDEEEADDEKKGAHPDGTTTPRPMRWMVLINYQTSFNPPKEWVSVDRVQFETSNSRRARVAVTTTKTTTTKPASSPKKKRTMKNPPQEEAPSSGKKQKKRATNRKNSKKNAVLVEKGKKPDEDYYEVEKVNGFHLTDKGGVLFEIKWVGGEVSSEPLWCLSQDAFDDAKALVLQALVPEPGYPVNPHLLRIAKKDFDIDVKDHVAKAALAPAPVAEGVEPASAAAADAAPEEEAVEAVPVAEAAPGAEETPVTEAVPVDEAADAAPGIEAAPVLEKGTSK